LKGDAELQPWPNGFEVTGLNPEFLRDPHPMPDRLRQDAPRHIHTHAPFLEAPTGPYLMQIEDCARSSRTPATGPIRAPCRPAPSPAPLRPPP
jgi:hypothetical protein